jgi:hypothetical protein
MRMVVRLRDKCLFQAVVVFARPKLCTLFLKTQNEKYTPCWENVYVPLLSLTMLFLVLLPLSSPTTDHMLK